MLLLERKIISLIKDLTINDQSDIVKLVLE